MGRTDATLLDVLVDGFEKNEIMDNFHWRELPLPDEARAEERFGAWVAEATRWQGPPERLEASGPRRLATWPKMEIRQAGRGIMVRAQSPWFSEWWNGEATWEGDPMRGVWEWLLEERKRR